MSLYNFVFSAILQKFLANLLSSMKIQLTMNLKNYHSKIRNQSITYHATPMRTTTLNINTSNEILANTPQEGKLSCEGIINYVVSINFNTWSFAQPLFMKLLSLSCVNRNGVVFIVHNFNGSVMCMPSAC